MSGESPTKARSVDPALESQYWEENFPSAGNTDPQLKYADYEPAYRFGWESYGRYEGRDFEDLHAELQRDWDMHRADSPLTWEKAKAATRDAWHRVEHGLHLDDATAPPGEQKRKPYETNSTMDRGDEEN